METSDGSQERETVSVDIFTGVDDREKLTAINLQDIVSTTIWKVKKFVTHDSDLEFGGMISKVVIRKMNITEKNMGGADGVRKWWSNHRKIVKDRLLRKRNNTGRKIREKMERTCHRRGVGAGTGCEKRRILT